MEVVGQRETSRFVRTTRALTTAVAHFGSVWTLPRTRRFSRWANPCSTGARTAASALSDSFRPRVRGKPPWEVTEFGRKVLPKAQQAVHKWAEITRIGSATVVVEFLPQHAYFVSPVAAHLRDHMEIKLAPLSEHDRDRSRFEEVVVGRVADGVSDLVIGLPPKSLAKLEKTYLYTSRLEAMIPRVDDDRRDHLTLHEAAGISYTPSPSTARKG